MTNDAEEQVEVKTKTTLVSSIVVDGDEQLIGPGSEPCTYCREALHTFVKGEGKRKVFLCDACQWEQTAPYFVRRGVSELDWSKTRRGKNGKTVTDRRVGETEWEVVRRKDGVVVGSRKRADRAYAVCGMMNAGHEI